MRRTVITALALALLTAALAAGETASQPTHTLVHRSRARSTTHRRLAPEHHTTTAARRRLAAEHRQRTAASERRTATQDHSAREREESSSRYEAALHDRYREGFKAGYAAGLAAHGHAAHAADCRTAQPESAPEDAANLAPVQPGDSTPQPAADAQSATFTTIEALHHPPITLEASLRMLHEPAPPPLRGSLASLERQDQRLSAEGLTRIQDDQQLARWIATRILVPLPVSGGLTVNPGLPDLRRYCRPRTAQFLADLARIHDAIFHRPIQIDSAVRPVSYQRQLMRFNGNAAPARGQIASPHETGASIDIGKSGMTGREIEWMRRYLLTLQNAGLIDVEEEFEQACFHITVYDIYGHGRPLGPARRDAGDATLASDTEGQ